MRHHWTVLAGRGVGTDMELAGWVRLRNELCLSCRQQGFELLLRLMLLGFASSLLKTCSAGKNNFSDTENLLLPLHRCLTEAGNWNLCFILLNVLSFPAGVNDRGSAPDCTYGRKPASSLPR